MKLALRATALLSTLALLGAGCAKTTTTPPPDDNEPKTQSITYLVHVPDNKSYCDGENMDSDGYRKTITKEITGTIPVTTSTAELARQVALLVEPNGNFHNAFAEGTFNFSNGILTLPYVDGWAGISIAECYVKPEVEVNLLRLPGVTKVVWASAP